jgi:transposase
MGKHYSEELKNEIIAKFFNEGKSLNSLEKEYNISYKSIFNWIRKYRKNGTVQNDINHKRGRPKEIDIDYKERYEILKKYQAFIKAQREKK